MREWLTETEPTTAEIHGDILRRNWDLLDAEQRAALKVEGVRLASDPAAVDDLGRLPD
jgi:hypothetical protein